MITIWLEKEVDLYETGMSNIPRIKIKNNEIIADAKIIGTNFQGIVFREQKIRGLSDENNNPTRDWSLL